LLPKIYRELSKSNKKNTKAKQAKELNRHFTKAHHVEGEYVGEMQMKITPRDHCTLTRMAKIKNSGNTKCQQVLSNCC
jgi:hypothetical protein